MSDQQRSTEMAQVQEAYVVLRNWLQEGPGGCRELEWFYQNILSGRVCPFPVVNKKMSISSEVKISEASYRYDSIAFYLDNPDQLPISLTVWNPSMLSMRGSGLAPGFYQIDSTHLVDLRFGRMVNEKIYPINS